MFYIPIKKYIGVSHPERCYMVEIIRRKMVFLRNVVNFKWHVLPPLPHATLSDVSLPQQRGKVNWKLFLMKSGERVCYSVLAIYMNCMVVEWTQRFLLISRGKKWIQEINTYSGHNILHFNFAILHSKYPVWKSRDSSAFCARYSTCNLSFKYSFRKRMPFWKY